MEKPNCDACFDKLDIFDSSIMIDTNANIKSIIEEIESLPKDHKTILCPFCLTKCSKENDKEPDGSSVLCSN